MVEIHPSARKHGIRDGDILHAMKNALAIAYLDDQRRVYVGHGRNAALLEVMTSISTDGSELAIHAMKMRRKFAHLLGGP